MIKKFFTYPVFVVLFLSFIGVILFGSLLRHHYLGGERFQSLQNIAVIIAEVPMHARNMIKYRTLSLNKQLKLDKHKDKKRFEQFIENKRNALLVLPRYDHSLSRSVVDIIDLNNFEVIHTYKHDIAEMNSKIKNIDEFPRLKIENSPVRSKYQHPLLLEDGSIIGNGGKSVVFKIRRVKFETCSNFISNLAKFAFSENMCVSEFELDFCKTEFKSDLIRYNRNNKASSVNSMSTVSTLKTTTTKSVPTVDQVKENKEERQKLKAMKKSTLSMLLSMNLDFQSPPFQSMTFL